MHLLRYHIMCHGWNYVSWPYGFSTKFWRFFSAEFAGETLGSGPAPYWPFFLGIFPTHRPETLAKHIWYINVAPINGLIFVMALDMLGHTFLSWAVDGLPDFQVPKSKEPLLSMSVSENASQPQRKARWGRAIVFSSACAAEVVP